MFVRRGWWQSLGCLLYAMAYGRSPFELSAREASSGSVALSVLSGRVPFPATDPYGRPRGRAPCRCEVCVTDTCQS
jgi:serine/threonine protein kinase